MSEKSEHGGVRRAVDKAQDTVGGVIGQAKAAMVTSADTFVENAAIGDLYEIESARLALRRSTSPNVQAIARRVLTDHTASTHHLRAALEMNETRGVHPPPSELDARRRKMLEHLDAVTDDAFDSTYLDQQQLAHEETVSLLKSYRDKGDSPQLRSLAAGALPVVERHLQHIKGLRSH